MTNPPSQSTSLFARLSLFTIILLLAGLGWSMSGIIGGRGQACFGVVLFLGIAAACSDSLRSVNWRTIGIGICLQFVLALLILKVGFVYSGFEVVGAVVSQFLDFANRGSEFVFGPLAKQVPSDQAFGAGRSFGSLPKRCCWCSAAKG